jgi:hypothetical protein
MHFLAQLTPLRTCTRDHDERDREIQAPGKDYLTSFTWLIAAGLIGQLM